MRIDVLQSFQDYHGKDVMRGKNKLTLRQVISTAINAMDPQKPMTAEHKNKAYGISVRVFANKKVDLTLDDRKFIKDRVNEVYNPLICGRVGEIFEK